MTDNSLHEKLQSAYKAKHSTETALLAVQNDILLNLDRKRGVILVLLDLSAAFDTIDHSFLLERLASKLGIGGKAYDWFKSYLAGRSQVIYIDRETSSLVILIFGVPQGSVLGPILFTIYTIPLGELIRSFGITYHLYADDTQLYLSFDVHNNDDFLECLSKIEKCVIKIKSWMTANMLKLNGEKNEVVFISSPFYRSSFTVDTFQIGETAITPTPSTRNLGVIFDQYLDMSAHITSVCRNANFQLQSLKRIRKYLTQDSCAKLIHSFVTSRLDYSNSLLSGLPDCQLQKLQRILNTAARIVSLKPKFEHITPVLKDLHWLPVSQRIRFKVLLLMFKAYHGLAPSYLCEAVKPYCPVYFTRSSEKKLADVNTTPTPKLKYGERAFANYGSKQWNTIPVGIREITSLSKFKQAIKTHLFKESYGC